MNAGLYIALKLIEDQRLCTKHVLVFIIISSDIYLRVKILSSRLH